MKVQNLYHNIRISPTVIGDTNEGKRLKYDSLLNLMLTNKVDNQNRFKGLMFPLI